MRYERAKWITMMGAVVWQWLAPTGCGVHNVSYSPTPEYTVEHVADEWIGFSRVDDEIFKMSLLPEKNGTLLWAGPHEVFRYGITEWTIVTTNVLQCRFGTRADPHEPVEMTCVIGKNHLVATLNNGKGGWTREIMFRRARVLQEQLSKLDESHPNR
jgi:hypothetical protein